MRIYKKHDLERIACDLIIEDYKADKGYNFTNTSYGIGATCFCSIENKQDKHIEKTIHYCLDNKSWDSNDVQLVKFTKIADWSKPREERYHEKKEVIMTLYPIGMSTITVYTDDEEYAKQAREIRHKRWYRHHNSGEVSPLHKTYERKLEVGTKEYENAKEFIQNRKYINLKKDAPISLVGYLDKHDDGRFYKAETYFKFEYRKSIDFIRKHLTYGK